ncbi:MAG: hypothetical protein Q9223_004151 [Gallowayella weberi]
MSTIHSYSLNFLKPITPPSTKPKHQPQFPFLSLPAELRFHVYSYLLPTSVLISAPRPAYEKSARPWAIASVSRQLRLEALSYVYLNATFHIAWFDLDAYMYWINELDDHLGWLLNNMVLYGYLEIERLGRRKRIPKQPYPEYPDAIRNPVMGYLPARFKYLDDGTVCKRDIEEHCGDWCVRWMETAAEYEGDGIWSFIEALRDIVSQRRENGGSEGPGLGAKAIVRLVEATFDKEVFTSDEDVVVGSTL